MGGPRAPAGQGSSSSGTGDRHTRKQRKMSGDAVLKAILYKTPGLGCMRDVVRLKLLFQHTHSLRLLGRGGLAIDTATNGMRQCVLAPHVQELHAAVWR